MDKVRFELHTPEMVTLQTRGRIVDGRFGQQTYYQLADGRALYLDLDVSQKLNLLEVQPGETVGICKRGRDRWDVWLSPETENMRAAKQPSPLEQQLRGSITDVNEKRYNTLTVPRLVNARASAEDTRPSAPATNNGHQNTMNNTRNSSALVDEANAVVDAYAQVLDRALTTYQGRIKPDEIRSIVLSCYIQQGKAAKYAAA